MFWDTNEIVLRDASEIVFSAYIRCIILLLLNIN